MGAAKQNDSQPLMSVEEALKIILEKITPVGAQRVPLTQSSNRVLAQMMVAQVNVPPFANSAMDGYAVIAADCRGASSEQPVLLKVIDNLRAGATPTKALSSQTAIRIMTGAPIPEGADAVIRFEETSEYTLPSPLEREGPARGSLADDEILIY
ncbi:MAG: hypothetical protein HYR94_24955, partial [Chloroflexi bacterium]|nr:hypothetical protein [Chloroflexota bacterium]